MTAWFWPAPSKGSNQYPTIPIFINNSGIVNFCSLHAIAAKVSPFPESSGIRHIESSAGFRLHCLQSPTGPKVLLTWTPASPTAEKQKDLTECDRILKLIYSLYTDYALKNPFQAPEMPVKSDLFDAALISAIVS